MAIEDGGQDRCQSPLNTAVVHGHEQCVTCNQTSLNAAQGTPVRQIITWQLDIRGGDDARISYRP